MPAWAVAALLAGSLPSRRSRQSTQSRSWPAGRRGPLTCWRGTGPPSPTVLARRLSRHRRLLSTLLLLAGLKLLWSQLC